MKRIITLVAVSALFALSACGQTLIVGEKTYPNYGVFSPEDKSDKICYELSVGNVIWSIILVETIIAPIYFVGWSLYNPVHSKPADGCGIDAT